MAHDEILDEICADLNRVAERLDDLAYDLLREAVRDKADKRPELERRVTRARRAIERAIQTLNSLPSAAGEEE